MAKLIAKNLKFKKPPKGGFFVVFLVLFSLSTMGKVIKHEMTDSHLSVFDYKEFCTTMKAKSTTLISMTGVGEIECFNEKFKIADFCIKKLPLENSLTRGYAVESEKKVYCEEAKSLMLTVTCDTSKDICFKPKISCEGLKKIFAYRLNLFHYANIDKNLECYYSKFNEENLNEL